MINHPTAALQTDTKPMSDTDFAKEDPLPKYDTFTDDYYHNVPIRIHGPAVCAGEWCCFHKPSDHHMRDWPMHIRETTLVERICKCGTGHPDPDSVAALVRITGEEHWGIHGCCGCCLRKEDSVEESDGR